MADGNDISAFGCTSFRLWAGSDENGDDAGLNDGSDDDDALIEATTSASDVLSGVRLLDSGRLLDGSLVTDGASDGKVMQPGCSDTSSDSAGLLRLPTGERMPRTSKRARSPSRVNAGGAKTDTAARCCCCCCCRGKAKGAVAVVVVGSRNSGSADSDTVVWAGLWLGRRERVNPNVLGSKVDQVEMVRLRLRDLITDVFSAIGRCVPCTLKYRPHALHRYSPLGPRRHNGVFSVYFGHTFFF